MPFTHDALTRTFDSLAPPLSTEQRNACTSALAYISTGANVASAGFKRLPNVTSTDVMCALCATLMIAPATQDEDLSARDVHIAVFCADRSAARLFYDKVHQVLVNVDDVRVVVHTAEELSVLRRITGRSAQAHLAVYPAKAQTLRGVHGDVVFVSNVPRTDDGVVASIVVPLAFVKDVRVVVQRAPIEDDVCEQMSSLGVNAPSETRA